MKTTLEIPDEVFREAKSHAALRGIPFRQLVTEALESHKTSRDTEQSETPPWMQGFGELAHLHEETKRIDAIIQAEFGTLEAEDLK